MPRGEDFGFETTLSGRRYLSLIQRLKKRGYQVHFFFLWVLTVDVALTRIKNRALEGGHDVAESVVRRRFDRSIRNFLAEYRLLADSWFLFDNSASVPAEVVFQKHGRLHIIDQELYNLLIARYVRL